MGVNNGTVNHYLPPGKVSAVRVAQVILTFASSERAETPPKPFATIPFSRDRDFVDRGDILNQLRQRCSEPAGRVALVGLGGIGYAWSWF